MIFLRVTYLFTKERYVTVNKNKQNIKIQNR